MRTRLSYPYRHYFFFSLTIFFLSVQGSFAAVPPNDSCGGAIPIVISNGGFGLDLFTGTTTDLTSATLQSGETFAPSILVAGLNKKSVWYKFTLPTTRAARISLTQPGSGIQAGNVGFAVYKTNTCIPGNTEISTKFSPIEIFGSSFHPCVESGDYLVQVTSNLNANGPVFITVEISDPMGAPYDKPVNAYNFANININKVVTTDFLVQCQSIDNAAENCLPNSSFKDFTKSTWHTFTTPAYFDWFSVLLTAMDNVQAPDYVVGYRIYQGDSRITPVSSLVISGGCDSMKINGYYPDRKMYKCGDLLPNTTYTVQLLYHKDFIKTLRMAVAWNGTTLTNGPEPVNSLPTPNNMGTLQTNSTGLNNTASDVLACNSRHSQHNCPKSMPATGLLYGGKTYNLSTFFTFNLATTNTLNITSIAAAGQCASPLMRLYKQATTNNCADLDTANIISTFIYNSGVLQCLEPGNYVLQAMGVDSTNPRTSLHWSSLNTTSSPSCIQNNLANDISITINAKTEVATNKFSLSAPGKFDKINADVFGVMQPLQKGITYTATPDTMGCSNTVLPDDNICKTIYNETYTKASYREFVVTDSFILSIPDYISSSRTSKLYKGDINALATAQNAFGFPQKISGLQPYSFCMYAYSNNTQNACIIPGTYTIANFDNRIGVEATTKFTIIQVGSPGTELEFAL